MVLPGPRIARHEVWQETAALRDFEPANVGSGSNSTELAKATSPFTSVMAPIATDSVCQIELSRSAIN